jgi:hypothetical protein
MNISCFIGARIPDLVALRREKLSRNRFSKLSPRPVSIGLIPGTFPTPQAAVSSHRNFARGKQQPMRGRGVIILHFQDLRETSSCIKP